MHQEIVEIHTIDDDGNPAGGTTTGTGINITWQDGPLARPGGTRATPNGAFVEGVIQAAIGRLQFFQESRFNSRYNTEAIAYLEEALGALDRRTADREKRGVEGTHKV